MPTLLAIITAGLAGYLVNMILKGFSVVLSGIVSFVISILLFYFMKRFISGLKPCLRDEITGPGKVRDLQFFLRFSIFVFQIPVIILCKEVLKVGFGCLS